MSTLRVNPASTRIVALGAVVVVGVFLTPDRRTLAQDLGVIVGTVVDEFSGIPVEGATVSVPRAGLEVVTDALGRFILEGIPEGQVELRTARDGYVAVSEPIGVQAAEAAFLQIGLRPVAVLLEELLVNAGRRSGDAARSEVSPRPEISGRSALDVISEDIPGVRVRRGSGDLGTGSTISIRGASSFTNNVPAIYLDGVRIDDVDGQVQAMSALDLIPAEMISRVRVLRGASAGAAFAYGANGVILVETRRGQEPRR